MIRKFKKIVCCIDGPSGVGGAEGPGGLGGGFGGGGDGGSGGSDSHYGGTTHGQSNIGFGDGFGGEGENDRKSIAKNVVTAFRAASLAIGLTGNIGIGLMTGLGTYGYASGMFGDLSGTGPGIGPGDNTKGDGSGPDNRDNIRPRPEDWPAGGWGSTPGFSIFGNEQADTGGLPVGQSGSVNFSPSEAAQKAEADEKAAARRRVGLLSMRVMDPLGMLVEPEIYRPGQVTNP